jgi:peptidoglycan/LPS O-acetylase OafA/YrhL
MNLFTTEIFTEGILPFLLVFVLVFAILQKTKVLGENKSQIDAMVSLAIGLILISMPTPRGYIVDMLPWLAVALVVLLILFLIYGFAAGSDKEKGFVMPEWAKKGILILGIIFVVILVLVVSGYWDNVKEWYNSGEIAGNVLIVIAIAIALWVSLG